MQKKQFKSHNLEIMEPILRSWSPILVPDFKKNSKHTGLETPNELNWSSLLTNHQTSTMTCSFIVMRHSNKGIFPPNPNFNIPNLCRSMKQHLHASLLRFSRLYPTCFSTFTGLHSWHPFKKKKSGAPTRVLRTSMGKHAFHWFPIKWNVETTWNSSQVVADAFWLISFLGHFVKLKASKIREAKLWAKHPNLEKNMGEVPSERVPDIPPGGKKENHWLKSADFGKRICLICWFPGGWWIPIFFPQFFITQINPSNNHIHCR